MLTGAWRRYMSTDSWRIPGERYVEQCMGVSNLVSQNGLELVVGLNTTCAGKLDAHYPQVPTFSTPLYHFNTYTVSN